MPEAKTNALKWNYVDYAPLLNYRPVLILESNDRNIDDNQAMAEALRKAGNPRVTENPPKPTTPSPTIASPCRSPSWTGCKSLPAPAAK